jgi:nucleoside-diphosphate kinase
MGTKSKRHIHFYFLKFNSLPFWITKHIACAMAIQKTLILFKPDAVEKNIVGSVLERFQTAGFQIRGIKMLLLTRELLTEHYAHIADRPFFPEVADFMSKCPVVALALEGEDAIARVRDLLGPTDSTKAAKGTIRGDFGETNMINVCHASDSEEAAAVELARFFSPTEIFNF